MRRAIALMLMVTLMAFSAGCATTQVKPSTLSHGMVKKAVVKGQTTQADLLDLFGGPNTTTISKGGEEVWVYEKMSYMETKSGGADPRMVLLGAGAGTGVGTIIGHQSKNKGVGALLGAAAGALAGGLASYKDPVSENGSKKVTFMVWFDENDIVKDYSVKTTQF